MDFILKVIEAGVNGIERIGVVNFLLLGFFIYFAFDKAWSGMVIARKLDCLIANSEKSLILQQVKLEKDTRFSMEEYKGIVADLALEKKGKTCPPEKKGEKSLSLVR